MAWLHTHALEGNYIRGLKLSDSVIDTSSQLIASLHLLANALRFCS